MMIMIIMASEPGDELPPGGADSAAAAESDGHSGWPHRRGRDHCRRDGGLESDDSDNHDHHPMIIMTAGGCQWNRDLDHHDHGISRPGCSSLTE